MTCCGAAAKGWSPAVSSATTACEPELPAACQWDDIADLPKEPPLGCRWADMSSEDEDLVETPAAIDPGRPLRGTSPGLGSPGRRGELLRHEPLAPRGCQEARGLRAAAPDFVPTLTMVCPLVGVCCVVPEVAQQPPLGHGQVLAAVAAVPMLAPALAHPCSPTLVGPHSQVPRVCGPAEFEAQGASASAPPRPTEQLRRPRHARKPRPAPLRTPTSATDNSLALVEEPAVLDRPAVAAVAAAPAVQQGQMPEATEEEWQHRVEMRQRSIALAKATFVYRWYSGLRRCEEREEGEPQTPDPTDRTISKRHWKYLVQRWREALHNLHLEDRSGSTQSADDWQSTVTTATTATGSASTVAMDGDDASFSA